MKGENRYIPKHIVQLTELQQALKWWNTLQFDTQAKLIKENTTKEYLTFNEILNLYRNRVL